MERKVVAWFFPFCICYVVEHSLYVPLLFGVHCEGKELTKDLF